MIYKNGNIAPLPTFSVLSIFRVRIKLLFINML